MKRLILILVALLASDVAHAQWSISPKTITNSQSYTFTVNSLDRDKEYKWVMSVRGMANLTVRIHTVYNNIPSGYLRLDSIYIPSPGSAGLTMFTYGITGDSLMNLWLPDDSGSLGTPGLNLKKTGSWSATITVQTQISGNTGVITMANAAISFFTPPPISDDYAYTRWLAGVDYLTPAQIVELLSDTLDLNPRGGGGTPADTAHFRDAMQTRGEQQDTTLFGQARRREQQLSDSVRNALSNAGTALAAGQAAQGQADRASYMSEHDSTLVCTDDYNAGDLNTTHPRIYVFTTAGKSLILANASAHPNGARYTMLNAADGDVFLQYQTGDDPDNSGNGVDTVAQQQWRMIVAADGLWKVITATPGPQGPQGATGPQGLQGVPGTTPSLAAYKDTTTEHSQYHKWTKEQNIMYGVRVYPTGAQASRDTNIYYMIMMAPPTKATDKASESYIPYGVLLKWNTTYDNGVIINRLTGKHAYGWYRGLNPQGLLSNKEGLYYGTELWQDNQGYPFNLGHYNGILEEWVQIIDTLGNTHRTVMDIYRRGDGRLIQSERAADVFYFENGSGISPASPDSIGMSIIPPRSLNGSRSQGIIDTYDSQTRRNVTNPRYGVWTTNQRPDSVALGYYGEKGLEDYGGPLDWWGAPNGVACSALAYPPQSAIRARQVQVWLDAVFSRVTLDANEVRRTSSSFLRPGSFVDSLTLVTQSYVDSVVNQKIRTAMQDTGKYSWLDAHYARSGGSVGVDLTTNQSISGKKTFNDSLKVTNVVLPPNVYTMKFVGTNPTGAGVNWHFIDTRNLGGNTWAKLYVNDDNASQSSLELRGFNGATFRSVMGNGTGSDVSTMNGGAIVAGATVTAPTGLFDSTEVRFVLTDSVKATRWFQSDTGRWCYAGFTRGTGNYVSTGYRYGKISMKAQIKNDYGRHASFKIVVDSANGVRGVNTFFVTTAVTSNGYSSLGPTTQNSSWQMPRGGMSYSGGGWGGESSIELTASYGSAGLCEYWLYSNNGYWVTVNVDLEFAIPNTGSSTWYAKIIGL